MQSPLVMPRRRRTADAVPQLSLSARHWREDETVVARPRTDIVLPRAKFLDSFPYKLNVPVEREVPPAPVVKTERPATPRAPQKNASRERMVTELKTLRLAARRLETELSYLKQLARERLQVKKLGSQQGSPTLDGDVDGWRAVAEKQRQRRLRAEWHNRRLRQALQTYKQEYGEFESVIGARAADILTKITQAQESQTSSVPALEPKSSGLEALCEAAWR